MGGEIQWPALEILCEIYGIENVEGLINNLCAIREYNYMRARNGRPVG